MRSLLLIAVLAGMASMAGPSAAAPDPDLLVLDDFEGEMRWEGVTPSLKVVHGGKRAGRWHDLKTTPRIAMKSVPKDWSRYDRIAWLHCARRTSKPDLLLQSDNRRMRRWDYYYHHFEVDWSGWRFLAPFGHEIRCRARHAGGPRRYEPQRCVAGVDPG